MKFREEVFKKKVTDINAFMISNLKNLYYLTGFDGEGIALITPDANIIFTDSRYTEQAKKESKDFEIITDEAAQKQARLKALNQNIEKYKIKRLAVEGDFVSYLNYKEYNDFFSVELVDGKKAVEKLRIIKDKDEIIKIHKACQITTETLKEISDIIEPGMRELDIANELAYTMRKKGALGEAFEAIVVSGERTSLPHGKPSEKKINEGELITIDTGSNYQKYNSDMTRTFVIGKENNKQKEIYNIVFDAQKTALESVKPGLKCSELDKIARDIIKEKGYGQYFGHGLGHGVGLDIHESPRVSTNDETVLMPGMIITIEPGIYLPNVGGVRIEDTVLVTEDGYEVLTWFPKEMNI